MFWGLIMEPKRRYTQKVKRPFHISMAALDIFSADDEPTQLLLHFEERNYLLCTLQKGGVVQCALDLNFEAGDEVVFATNGHSNVHLSGYLQEELEELIEEQEEEEEDNKVKLETTNNKRKVAKSESQPPKKKTKLEQLLDQTYDSEDDDTFALPEEEEEDASSEEDVDEEGEEEEDDEADDLEMDEEDDSDEDDEEVSSLSEDEQEDIKPKENGVTGKKRNKRAQTQNEEKFSKTANKIQKLEKSPKAERTPGKQEKTPKSDNLLKLNKTPKGEKTPKGNKTPKAEVKTPSSPNQQTSTPQKREGGVTVQDLKVGEGNPVKAGKVVQVYYEGRLKHNNKVFDQNSKGSGFKFRVGRQEVIKGWDVGLNGMKVGGKRRIICPPNMAYGNKGSPPVIPPNSTLVFDVELKNIL